jgi:hypothetical protein
VTAPAMTTRRRRVEFVSRGCQFRARPVRS